MHVRILKKGRQIINYWMGSWRMKKWVRLIADFLCGNHWLNQCQHMVLILPISSFLDILKRRPLKIVKHTQTIRRQQPTNCLSVFDHFLGLVLEGLICSFFDALKVAVIFFVEIASNKLYKVVNSVLQNDGR